MCKFGSVLQSITQQYDYLYIKLEHFMTANVLPISVKRLQEAYMGVGKSPLLTIPNSGSWEHNHLLR